MNNSRNAGKNKVLLFKRIMTSAEGKEGNLSFSCGIHYLASSLKKTGISLIFSDSRISLDKNEFITQKDDLLGILKDNPDINFIAVSLSEFYFEKVKKLVSFLRKNSRAFIGIGGIMPTLTPRHVFVHLPKVNFLVRGAGEVILPKVVEILNGKNIDSPLTKEEIKRLSTLKGFLFSNGKVCLSRGLDYINKVEDYDNSSLDFSFITKDDLAAGITLFTSWGCFNDCFFCTSPVRAEYRCKSFGNLKDTIGNYHKRLTRIYGEEIPPCALNISFYDDDFLGEDRRAVRFFGYLRDTPFKIDFFQTGINSFFEKINGKYSNTLNQRLLGSIEPGIFNPSGETNIYIGLENLSDEELTRLGKGYNYRKAEKVIKSLALKKIKVAYHFIASNQLTSLENILENLLRFSIYQILYGQYFRILTPIIPYLISLYPSLSYKICKKNGRGKFFKIRRILSKKNKPAYDYPLIDADMPVSKAVRGVIPFLYGLFIREKNYLKILDETLLRFLLMGQENPSIRIEVSRAIEKYKDYPRLIAKKTKYRKIGERSNIQLMITRRCHLRCTYCPVKKENKDMSQDVLYRAIDLLFTSSQTHLRLDFTGGEPLLRFDLVKKAVQYSRKLARKSRKSVSYYLVTNAIALSDDIADFLAREEFFLELSVDGKEEFHNLYKIARNPKLNPYRLTKSNLNSIFSRKINNYVVIVVTPLTAAALLRNFCHLLKLGFRQIGINYALCTYWDERSSKELLRQLDLIRRRFFLHIKCGKVRLSNLESRLEPAILNCEIMVDVDGRLFFLTDGLFEQKRRKSIPALGRIQDIKSLDEIFITRFRIAQRLLEYNPSPKTKGLIVNNIAMGELVGKFFKEWKRQLKR